VASEARFLAAALAGVGAAFGRRACVRARHYHRVRYAPAVLQRRKPSLAAARRHPPVKLGEQFPKLEDSGVLDELIPKKDKMVIAKWCEAARFGPATPLRDG
jgi:hypothetical protein